MLLPIKTGVCYKIVLINVLMKPSCRKNLSCLYFRRMLKQRRLSDSFGTVWGLIHAFMGIAQQKSADISAVAPGIAEALITTLGGLIIAIPALVMFNYLTSEVRKLKRMRLCA